VRCPYALGRQTYESRTLQHSLPICFFFDAFSAKMLLWLLPHLRSDDMTQPASRRTVLLATGAAALAVGCSDNDDNDESSSEQASPASGGQRLASTADIPVGGGKIFKDEKVVVTQPTKGDFKAFSAVCTHQGCTVGSVADGLINCPCHKSSFRIADGSVTSGPATRPLPAEQITVEGDSIKLA
jgi:Rieske Fe-S protein